MLPAIDSVRDRPTGFYQRPHRCAPACSRSLEDPYPPLMQFAKETINAVLLWRMDAADDGPVYYAEDGSGFRAVSAAEAKRNNGSWAAALLRRGYAPGTRVAILAGVRAEWAECDCGNLLARLVTVGIYPTCTADQIAYILEHSETRILVVGDQADLDHCASAAASAPELDLIVTMEPGLRAPEGLAVPLVELETLLTEGDAALADGDDWLESTPWPPSQTTSSPSSTPRGPPGLPRVRSSPTATSIT